MNALRRHPVLAVLGALLTAVLALLGINAFDRELTPQARALFARPDVTIQPDSAFSLLTGFNAPAGSDPRAYARSARKAVKQRSRGGRSASRLAALDVRAASELVCIPQEADCTRLYAKRPEAIADLVADNAELLGRYEELLRARGLADTAEALEYYETSFFGEVLRTQLVRLTQVGVAAGSGDLPRAIAWLEPDAAFHRRWLEEAGSILTKMLAVRTYSRDLLLAGQIARSNVDLSPDQWGALERIAAPLTPTERGVGPVLRAEAYFFSQVLDRMIAEPRATSEIIEAPRLMATVVSATVKRNATLNFAYPLFADWLALDAVESDQLEPAVERVRASIRRAGERDWTWLYNYSGKSFTAESPPDLGEYVYRVRDLDALGAVTRCVIALRRAGIEPAAAGPFIGSSPACRDPYGGALGWDRESMEVSFRARSPGQVKRFGGRGDRVAFAAYVR